MTRRAIALSLLCLALPGCKDRPSERSSGWQDYGSGAGSQAAPAVKLRPAPVARWSDYGANLNLEGEGLAYGVRVSMLVAHGTLTVTPVDLPLGSIVQILGRSIEVTGDHVAPVELPLAEKIAELPWSSLRAGGRSGVVPPQIDLDLPVKVIMPGRQPLDTKMPPTLVTAGLADFFVALAAGTRWPGETQPPAGVAAAAWTFADFAPLGTAGTTRDVRMIVLATTVRNQRTRRCTGYVGAADFTATSFDVELAIVDRWTKQKLATRSFAGSPSCPTYVYAQPGQAPASSSGPSATQMRAWVSAQLGPLAKTLPM